MFVCVVCACCSCRLLGMLGMPRNVCPTSHSCRGEWLWLLVHDFPVWLVPRVHAAKVDLLGFGVGPKRAFSQNWWVDGPTTNSKMHDFKWCSWSFFSTFARKKGFKPFQDLIISPPWLISHEIDNGLLHLPGHWLVDLSGRRFQESQLLLGKVPLPLQLFIATWDQRLRRWGVHCQTSLVVL